VIRSVGQIRSMDDIRHTMLTVRDGAPILVGDVATVTVGFEPRLGIAGTTPTTTSSRASC
jgi:cobalt-zinc-cadmium resistance protein CzcA